MVGQPKMGCQEIPSTFKVGCLNGSVADLSIHHPLGFKDGTPLKVLV